MLEIFPTTIPQLTQDEERNVFVYVPDRHEEYSDERYPVLYMFDGHNVFLDETATYGKSWGMLEFLVYTDLPLIVVGVECNHHNEGEEGGGRLSEYSPFTFKSSRWGTIEGKGKITMDWMVNELKPYIDANYPTITERDYTFIAGSSMGGLMTLYALSEYNEVFSRGAALSPALYFNSKEVEAMIKEAQYREPTVLYMDCGTSEMRYEETKLARVQRIYGNTTDLLIKKGVTLTSRLVLNGEHSEASWERQIPYFIDVLFYELEGF